MRATIPAALHLLSGGRSTAIGVAAGNYRRVDVGDKTRSGKHALGLLSWMAFTLLYLFAPSTCQPLTTIPGAWLASPRITLASWAPCIMRTATCATAYLPHIFILYKRWL